MALGATRLADEQPQSANFILAEKFLFNMIATYYFGNDVDDDGDLNLDFN